MKRLIFFLLFLIFSAGNVFSEPDTSQTTTRNYEVEVEGNFFSNLIISILGGDFLKDSKEIAWQDTLNFAGSRLVQKEIKIKNLKGDFFSITKNGEKYSGFIFLKEKSCLKEKLVENLFSITTFLESNFAAGEKFETDLPLEKKTYKLKGEVLSFNTMEEEGKKFTSAVILIEVLKPGEEVSEYNLMPGKSSKKIVRLEVEVDKSKELNGKINSINIKTFSPLRLEINISLKK